MNSTGTELAGLVACLAIAVAGSVTAITVNAEAGQALSAFGAGLAIVLLIDADIAEAVEVGLAVRVFGAAGSAVLRICGADIG